MWLLRKTVYAFTFTEYGSITKCICPREITYQCEYRCKDEDGHLFWVNSVGRLFMDAKSGDLYLHGILVNIDDRKKLNWH